MDGMKKFKSYTEYAFIYSLDGEIFNVIVKTCHCARAKYSWEVSVFMDYESGRKDLLSNITCSSKNEAISKAEKAIVNHCK